MRFRTNHIVGIVIALAAFSPIAASAHAVPVESSPASSATLDNAPKNVSIRFSERIEESASSIAVLAPSGKKVSVGEAEIEPSEPRTLLTQIQGEGEGIYTVKWTAVSEDDGHFTRGSYEFSVGTALSPGGASSEVVQITTVPEALATTVELLGNGIIWACILLFAFAVRPLFREGKFEDQKKSVARVFTRLFFVGAALALSGACVQIFIKSSQLQLIREVPLLEATLIYIGTAAGMATVVRAAAIVFVAFVHVFARRAIASSSRFTLYEIALVLGMCVFAYFRAKISHATANPFYPDFSIFVNFIHVIEKDLWAGVLIVISALLISRKLSGFLMAMIPRAFTLLVLDFIAVSLTAGYIIWLHLKSFDNLFTTNWGGTFLNLLIAAVFLVLIRTYHVATQVYSWRTLVRYLSVSLGIEAALSILVVYYSSVVIITSPPLAESAPSFDSFTLTMCAIVVGSTLFGLVLYVYARRTVSTTTFSVSSMPELPLVASFLAVTFTLASFIAWFSHSSLSNPFKAECESDGNMWHFMVPMKAGVPTSDLAKEGCMWGMGNYMYMFPDRNEYESYRDLGESEVLLTTSPRTLVAGVPATFSVAVTDGEGRPATLFVDMERLIHVVIVSRDQTVFDHIHPDDKRALTKEEIDTSTFSLDYAFLKAGEYLISVDYAHGVQLKSRQFVVNVSGNPKQAGETRQYTSPGEFQGYRVSLDYSQPFAKEVATLRYTITRDGRPVTDVVPYLSAAMHVAVVKNDFSSFIHTHGEVHPPGQPIPPILVKNGKVVHTMAAMQTPSAFGPTIDAHLIFPSAGLYTAWGQFKVGDTIIPTSFTIRVEE